ncbi:cytochrome c biogenesis CcdA family protein [Burkholderia anthina]|uniref:cytochrome c biogenesis CcdA family protein n=1 Tax=Burkholderia anthina TaxID=179879 RepID=UPI001FB80DB8|nr:cytochrome c biogenesis protein CcdA [Burkholderia anthina]
MAMGLETLRQLASQSVGIASGISLLAGLLFSVSPLAIAALPVPLAYVTRARAPCEAVRYGLAFVGGLIAAHALLGAVAGLGGHGVQALAGRWWGLLLGPWLIVLGLLWTGWIRLPLPVLGFKAKHVGSTWGAFALGVPFSVAICPSCAPALVVLLGAAAASGSPLFGAAMLTAFAVGRAIPLALAAAAMEWIEQIKPLGRFRRTFELAGSVLLMLAGLYLLNGYFAVFPWLTW